MLIKEEEEEYPKYHVRHLGEVILFKGFECVKGNIKLCRCSQRGLITENITELHI
jgi:hypothetical protein